MSVQPPALDPRRFEQLRAAVLQRATALVPEWRPGSPGSAGDVGLALAAIFAHDLELLLDRLNRVPEKSLLQFLDLLGVGLLPPGAARAPLVFGLAETAGSTGLVPAGTSVATVQTATQPAVLFETEADLAVVAARLVELFTIDPTADRFGDWSPVARGERATVFPALRGDRLIPHTLALGLDPLLRLANTAELRLRFDLRTSLPDAQTESLLRSLAWEVRTADANGVLGWQPVAPPAVAMLEVGGGSAAEVVFPSLPAIDLLPLGAPAATPPRLDRWLRASLTMPMVKRPGFEAVEVARLAAQVTVTADRGIAPDHALVNGAAVNLAGSFQAFGPNPQYGDTLVIGSEEALAGAPTILPGQTAPAGRVEIHLELAKSDAVVIWERAIRDGDDVVWIDAEGQDDTRGFTEHQQLLQLPRSEELPFLDKQQEFQSAFLFRARVERGRFARAPLVRQFALLMDGNRHAPRVGFTSDAPLDLVIAGRTVDVSPLTPLNLREAFYPFGISPQPGSTFYVLVPQAPQELRRDPVVRLGLPSARVGWEYLSASGWRPLGESGADGSERAQAPGFSDTTHALTAPSGTVSFERPEDLTQTEIDGELSSWVRARPLAGGYGRPLTLEPVDPTDASRGFRVQPGTGATDPPLVEAVRLSYERAEPAPRIVTRNGFRLKDQTATNQAPDGFFRPFEPVEETAPTLYVGFDRPLPSVAVNLLFAAPARLLVEPLARRQTGGEFVPVRPPTDTLLTGPPPSLDADNGVDSSDGAADAPGAAADPIRWEYWNGRVWAVLVVADGTSHLTESGIVQAFGPADMAPLPGLDEAARHWIRIVRQSADRAYEPTLIGVFVNAVDAIQASSVRNESLGSSTGGKRQTFRVARRPVFSGQQLVVVEPEPPPGEEQTALTQEEGADAVQTVAGADGRPRTLVRWHEVGSLAQSGPRSRHYTLDRIGGVVQFGDGEHGMIPPPGRDNVLAAAYRAGGGAEGNQPAGAISVLKTAIPYIATVSNPIPADGGSGAETIQAVQQRGPQILAHRGRAVTAADYEWLARQAAGTRVARARCLPNRDQQLQVARGRVTVVIVPDSPDPRPLPASQLIREVEDALSAQVTATLLTTAPASVAVVGPAYLPVEVQARVLPRSLLRTSEARAAALAALRRFLHPLSGGPDGTGWPFGRDVYLSELFAMLETLPEVEHVKRLTFAPNAAMLPLQLAAPIRPPATVEPGARVVLSLAADTAGGSTNGPPTVAMTGVLVEPIPGGRLTCSLMVALFREGERIRLGGRGAPATATATATETTIRGITGSSLLVDPFEPRTALPAGTEVAALSSVASSALAVELEADTPVSRLELPPLDLGRLLVTLPDTNIGAFLNADGSPVRFVPPDAPRRVAGLGQRLRVPDVSLVYAGQCRVEITPE